MLSPPFIPESVFIPEYVFYTQSVVRSPYSAVHVLYWPMRKGDVQKMLNEYFDRECEWI